MKQDKYTSYGFTLIELTVVLVIIAMLFSMVLPNLEGLSPTFQLRALGRSMGSTMEQAQSEAIVQGGKFGIRYDLDKKKYGLLLPLNYMQDDKDSGASNTEREILRVFELEEGLKINAIILPDGKRITTGQKDIDLSSLGAVGSHIVEIENSDNKKMWIKFNGFTGIVSLSETEIAFHKYQGTN